MMKCPLYPWKNKQFNVKVFCIKYFHSVGQTSSFLTATQYEILLEEKY